MQCCDGDDETYVRRADNPVASHGTTPYGSHLEGVRPRCQVMAGPDRQRVERERTGATRITRIRVTQQRGAVVQRAPPEWSETWVDHHGQAPYYSGDSFDGAAMTARQREGCDLMRGQG